MVNLEKVGLFFKERKDIELKRISDTRENVAPGFNLFALISDIYYRENMHSDILREILSPNGNHGEGDLYLRLFLDFINSFCKVPQIDIHHYRHGAKAVREAGRRDITISTDKRAIIIENKINDAGDTANQIPTYYNQLKDDFEIDAIVYLTLSQTKEPDRTTWGKDYDKTIDQKLVSIRAYEGKSTDLCNGWLKRCIETTSHIDNLSILRQYFRIIKFLTRNHMDIDFMQKFKEFLEENKKDNYSEVALSIRKTVDDYPAFITKNILDHFKVENRHIPFKNIAPAPDGPQLVYLSNYYVHNYAFCSVIWISLDQWKIDFSVRNPKAWSKKEPEAVIKAIGYDERFVWNNEDRFLYVIKDNFMNFESQAIEFIEGFLKTLTEKKSEIELALKNIKISE